MDPNIRSKLRIFSKRTARQCNDLVKLHNMQDFYRDEDLRNDLSACEIDYIECLLKIIGERLLYELHCMCVNCIEWRELRIIEEQEAIEFEREHF